MSRVDLIEEDLAVKLPQEGLNQLEDAIVELSCLTLELLLLIDRDIGVARSHRLAERLFLDARV